MTFDLRNILENYTSSAEKSIKQITKILDWSKLKQIGDDTLKCI